MLSEVLNEKKTTVILKITPVFATESRVKERHQRSTWSTRHRYLCLYLTLYAFMEGSPVRHAVMEKFSQEVESQLKTLKHKMGMQSGRMAAVKQNYSIIIQAL
ncbi:unnamed protein product [Eretmochelys imbricata]